MVFRALNARVDRGLASQLLRSRSRGLPPAQECHWLDLTAFEVLAIVVGIGLLGLVREARGWLRDRHA